MYREIWRGDGMHYEMNHNRPPINLDSRVVAVIDAVFGAVPMRGSPDHPLGWPLE